MSRFPVTCSSLRSAIPALSIAPLQLRNHHRVFTKVLRRTHTRLRTYIRTGSLQRKYGGGDEGNRDENVGGQWARVAMFCEKTNTVVVDNAAGAWRHRLQCKRNMLKTLELTPHHLKTKLCFSTLIVIWLGATVHEAPFPAREPIHRFLKRCTLETAL